MSYQWRYYDDDADDDDGNDDDGDDAKNHENRIDLPCGGSPPEGRSGTPPTSLIPPDYMFDPPPTVPPKGGQ